MSPKIKISFILAILTSLALGGCKNGGAEFRRVLRSAARESAKPNNRGSDTKKSGKTINVAGIKSCPEGAKLLGASPPSGTSQWCSLPTQDGKGSKHGEYRKWYDDGKTKVASYFDHGKGNGKFTEWYPNGQKKTQGNYLEDNKHGRWIEWNTDGVKRSEGSYKNGVPHGKFVSWSRKGAIESEGTYLDGQKTGVWTSYNSNAVPKARISFKAGKKHGVSEIYSRKGELKQVESYFADIPHGNWTTFWPNGAKKIEGTYVKGQKSGNWTTYLKDGTVKEVSLFKDGTSTKIGTRERPTKKKKRGLRRKRFGKGDILGVEPPINDYPQQPQTQPNLDRPSKLSTGQNWQSF